MALTTPLEVSAPALFKVGYWSVGSTPPSFARTATGNAIPLNIGLPGPGTYRAATADTGLTTTAPATIGAQTPSSAVILLALS